MQEFSSRPESIIGVIVFLMIVGVVVGILGLFVWSLVWVYSDAEKRGKPGCVVALLVFIRSWPFSLLFWILARPDSQGSSETLQ
jgi:drug/metabolite transporter (DMT)-like permease